MEKIRLSKTGIQTYKFCPKKYYFQFVEKIPAEEIECMTIGKDVHSKIEAFFNSLPKKISSNEELVQRFNDICLPDEYYKQSHFLYSFLNIILLLHQGFLKDTPTVAPKPINTEQKYYDESLGYVGVVDALFKFGSDVLLIDWKCSNFVKEKVKNYRQELAGYKYLVEKFNDIKVTMWGIGFLGNDVLWLESVNDKYVEKLFEDIKEVRGLIEQKKFDIPKYAPCKWCGYFEKCWEGENICL